MSASDGGRTRGRRSAERGGPGGFVLPGLAKKWRKRLKLSRRIADALDPVKVPSKPKTFATMTPEERAEMQRLYGVKP